MINSFASGYSVLLKVLSGMMAKIYPRRDRRTDLDRGQTPPRLRRAALMRKVCRGHPCWGKGIADAAAAPRRHGAGVLLAKAPDEAAALA